MQFDKFRDPARRDEPQGSPEYSVHIDPRVIHAVMIRAREERHLAVMATLSAIAHGVGWVATWVYRNLGFSHEAGSTRHGPRPAH